MTWTEKQNSLGISDPSHWQTLWPRAVHNEIPLPPPPAPSIIQGPRETAGAKFLTLEPKDTQTHFRSEHGPAAALPS